MTNYILMRKQHRTPYQFAKSICKWFYHYVVHVPHKESNWALAFFLLTFFVAAISMHF